MILSPKFHTLGKVPNRIIKMDESRLLEGKKSKIFDTSDPNLKIVARIDI